MIGRSFESSLCGRDNPDGCYRSVLMLALPTWDPCVGRGPCDDCGCTPLLDGCHSIYCTHECACTAVRSTCSRIFGRSPRCISVEGGVFVHGSHLAPWFSGPAKSQMRM